MAMTILLTGGAGNTAASLARQLKAAAIPFLMTSRRGKASAEGLQYAPIVEFDFSNSGTFDKPFQHPIVQSSPIQSAYIVVPAGTDPESITSFIDHAVQKYNVSRFVLLGSQGANIDAPYPFSKVWKRLSDIGVEHACLQPSWFNENLFKPEYLGSIKNENKFYSGTADGKLAWIAAEDIAAAAFSLLTSKTKLDGRGDLILGPELRTHDEIADILSSVLGRKIEHVRLSEEERYQYLLSQGLNQSRAKFVAYVEALMAKGISKEGFPSDNVRRLTGREPTSIRSWIELHKDQFT